MQTLPASLQESTMHIPPSVLGIILDTGNTKQREAVKTLTEAFLRLVPGPHIVSTFLIATADGVAFPISVNSETFERQWKELPWGKKSDITPGLQAMHTVMREYSKGITPAFRTLLLTGSVPVEQAAFRAALQTVGRVEIGVIGTGETQRQTAASLRTAIDYGWPVTITLIDQDLDPTLCAGMLFHALD